MNDQTEVAIVAAMDREVADLVRGWRVILGHKFRYYERDAVIVVIGGMGEDRARSAAEAVLTFRAPKVLLSVGLAGATVSNLAVGDIVLPTKVLSASGSAAFTIDGGEGTLISRSGIANASEKRALAKQFGCTAVDMEAAAVAEVAARRGIRFAAIKAISDEVGFDLPPLGDFIGSDGKFHTARFLAYVAVRPRLWPVLAALQRNAARAAQALVKVLAGVSSAADVEAMLSRVRAS